METSLLIAAEVSAVAVDEDRPCADALKVVYTKMMMFD